MKSNIGLFAGIIVISIVMTAVIALFNLNTILPSKGLRFDFYPHWVGGRAVWGGQTPYTPEITRQIQLGMFGTQLPSDADQQNLAYPAYTSIFLGPIIALPDATAIAVWMAVQLVAVMWTPIIWLAILNWRPHPLVLFALVLGLSFGFHYPIDTFILAQFSGTVLLSISLGVWLLTQGKDIYAGVIFTLATVPPTVGAPIALLILGAFAVRGRWKGLAAFIIMMSVVVGFSILRIGWWIPDWLKVVREYAAYAPPVWPPNFLPAPLNILLAFIVITLLAWAGWRFLRSFDALRPVQPSTLVVPVLLTALLLLPQTGYYYLVLLIPVIVACLHRARLLPTLPRLAIMLSCVLAVVSPWVYFGLPNHNPDTQSLLLPLHVGLTWLAANRF